MVRSCLSIVNSNVNKQNTLCRKCSCLCRCLAKFFTRVATEVSAKLQQRQGTTASGYVKSLMWISFWHTAFIFVRIFFLCWHFATRARDWKNMTGKKSGCKRRGCTRSAFGCTVKRISESLSCDLKLAIVGQPPNSNLQASTAGSAASSGTAPPHTTSLEALELIRNLQSELGTVVIAPPKSSWYKLRKTKA